MTKREQQIVRLITKRIKEIEPESDVILYGSHARGQAGKYSDWDILVLLDRKNVSRITEQRVRHHLLELELEIEEPISIFVKSKHIWETKHKITPFYQNIKEEGVLLT